MDPLYLDDWIPVDVLSRVFDSTHSNESRFSNTDLFFRFIRRGRIGR